MTSHINEHKSKVYPSHPMRKVTKTKIKFQELFYSKLERLAMVLC